MSEETQMGTRIPQIDPVTSELTLADRWIHILARWGIKRFGALESRAPLSGQRALRARLFRAAGGLLYQEDP